MTQFKITRSSRDTLAHAKAHLPNISKRSLSGVLMSIDSSQLLLEMCPEPVRFSRPAIYRVGFQLYNPKAYPE